MTRPLTEFVNSNVVRSYMFVEYESHRAAALARRKLVPGKVFLFGVEVGQVGILLNDNFVSIRI